MYRIEPQEYQRQVELLGEALVPPVQVLSASCGIHAELQTDHDEMCFVKTAAYFYSGKITLEEYFENLISHIEVNAVLHSYDKGKLAESECLFGVDIVAGTVKTLMRNRRFPRLQEEGTLLNQYELSHRPASNTY